MLSKGMILGLNWAREKLNLTFAKFKFETDFGLRFFFSEEVQFMQK